MTKKLKTASLLLLVLAISWCFMIACSQHSHTYSEEWEYNEQYHWHAATCEHTDKQGDKEEHTFDQNDECTKCGYKKGTSLEKVLLTVDAGAGGTIDGTRISTYEIEKGVKLREFLAGISLTANDGFAFMDWYTGDSEVGSDAVIQSNVVVTAKYAVNYTVSLYKQDIEGNYGEPEEITERDVYGERFEYVPEEEHFVVDTDKHNRLSTYSLDKDDEFFVYLKRATYRVTYVNEKATEPENITEEVVFGKEIDVEGSPFVSGTDRFAGWADESGEIQYSVGDSFTVSEDVTLYAVWDEAYVDRAGGGDLIYLPSTKKGEVILDRVGIEFAGTIDENGVFTVKVMDKTLTGKIDENGTFVYANVFEKGKYTHCNRYYGKNNELDENITLELDEYGKGKLTIDDRQYNGMCFIDAQMGDYVFAIDESTAIYFICEKKEGNLLFTIQGEEFGRYVEFVSATDFLVGNTGDGLITLDGYGEAVFYDTYYKEYYYGQYSVNAEKGSANVACIELYMYNEDGMIFGDRDGQRNTWVNKTIYCITVGEDIIYVYENEDASGTFNGEGFTLELDGFGGYTDSAVYTEGKTVKTGRFFAHDSYTLGTVAEVTLDNGDVMCFILKEGNACEKLSEQGRVKELVQLYVGEYNRYEFGGHVLVMYPEENGSIRTDVYAEYSEDEYELVERGSCTYAKNGDEIIYIFTKSELVKEDYENKFDSMTFVERELFDRNEIRRRTFYVLSKDGVNSYTELKSKDGAATMWFVNLGGYNGQGAFYQKDGKVLGGSFTYGTVNDWFQSETKYGTFRYADVESNTWKYIFFEISENGGEERIEEIDFLPYRMYVANDKYNYRYENFCIDAKGKAQYQVLGDYEAELGVVNGTYTFVETNRFGDKVYRFDPDVNDFDITSFEFVIEEEHIYSFSHGIASTVAVYYVKQDSAPQYESDNGTLTGDGFWFRGIFTDKEGNSVQGLLYNASDEDYGHVMIFETDDDMLLFDVLPDGKLSMRDGVDGYYKMLDENSQEVNKWDLELDGHGNFKVFDNSSYSYIYNNGTYAPTDEYGVFTMTVEMRTSMSISFDVLLLSVSGTNAAVLIDRENRGMYIGKDSSVMYLDGMNVEDCFYIDANGMGHKGDYYLFSDDFGVFNYADGSDVIPFIYDGKAKTFEVVDNSAYYGTYYAEDLRSAYVFEKTVSTDEYAGYYRVNEGKVTMYLFKESSGALSTKTGTFDGDRFTISSYPYSTYIKYSGEEFTLTGIIKIEYGDTKQEGLTLKFDPQGNGTFKVAATLNGKGEDKFKVDFNGWYLQIYYGEYDSVGLEVDLSAGTFVILCEYEYEYTALESVLKELGIIS